MSMPLVLCLTNTVAANFTANVLLAIGAKPAMIEEPGEAAELAALADAMLVNLGTVTEAQAETMRDAIQIANSRPIPWVLDPVAVQCLTYRRHLALEFIALRPALIRGNQGEIDFLAQTLGDDAKSTLGSVPVLATGAVDNAAGTAVKGGVEMLTLVTATGCAQGAICAAMLGWGQSPVQAALSASRLMKRAGEAAFAVAREPGSFQVALLDALYRLAGDYRD